MTTMADDPTFDCVGAGPLVANEGDTPMFTHYMDSINNYFAVITTTSEKKELAAKFLNYGYTEEGLLETEIIADNARHLSYDDGRESWEAFGNVVVKNLINQETMETDTLYWDQKNERIYTHCYVRMYSPDGFAQGYGMESDQRARDTELFNPFNNYAIMGQDSTKVVIDSVNFIGPLLKK